MNRYQKLRAQADRTQDLIWARIRKLAREAGLPDLAPLHSAHKAMVSFREGRPWIGVDYSKVRQIQYIQRTRLYQPHALVDAYFLRLQRTLPRGTVERILFQKSDIRQISCPLAGAKEKRDGYNNI